MTAYATLDDLIAAYVVYYNATYTDPVKHFTADDVRALCVEPLDPMTAAVKYGVSISRPTQRIGTFGYVAA